MTVGADPGGSRYVDLGILGRGGMAQVHLARREGPAGFKKLVALKRMLPQFADDPSFERMFLNEARLAAGLDHSNIAQVLDFGLLGGRYFIAMEYVHGHDLRKVLHAAAKQRPSRTLPIASALQIVRSVAAGLHYAHEVRDHEGNPLGLVHRDVSPSNVLVSDDGEVKLADFGVAKATRKMDETATVGVRGKLAYMSPEQARGEALDRRSDVFSLGIMLSEVTTGYRQFTGDNEYQLLNKVADAEITRPSTLVDKYPPQLEAIVVRALAAKREDRYQTSLELHDAIGAFALSQGLLLDAPALGEAVAALFGARPLPSISGETETSVFLGSATRPSTERASASLEDPQPKRRGLGFVAASMVLGVALGIGVTVAVTADDKSAAPVQPAATEVAPAPSATPAPAAEPSASPHAPAPEPLADAPSVEEVDADASLEEPVVTRARRRTKRGRSGGRRTGAKAGTKPSLPVEPRPAKKSLDEWSLPKGE